MKYAIAFSAVAAVAVAQSNVTPIDQLPADVQPVAQAITNINTSTNALDASINAFQGPAQVADLAGAATDVLQVIDTSNTDVAALTPLEDTPTNQDSAFLLVNYVNDLNGAVATAVTDLLAKRQTLIDACVGTVVQGQTVALQNASEQFITTTFNFIPQSLADAGGAAVQPIRDALSSAVSAFADQTTVPASCSGTTPVTSSTSGTESVVPPTSTPTGTQSGGMNIYPTYGTGSSGVYPTGSAYPTDGEDCDDEEPEESSTWAVWQPVYESTGGNGGAYPTGGEGGAYPTGGSMPTGGNGGSYPTGGSQPTGGSYPTGGSKPTGGNGGSYPTGGSQPTGGSYPTGGSKPSGGSPSSPAYTTTAKVSTYHGAAVANGVNFAVVAIAAAALLL